MLRKLLLGAAFLLLPVALCAHDAPDSDEWAGWRFLLGKWVGEGTAEPGKGGGYFTFDKDLQDKVLVRRNHAEYPATAERPAYVHDDLMIVYRDPGSKQTRAFFTDNEGHAIQYLASISADGNTITFLSEAQAASPRYRFTYVRRDTNRMTLSLEMAPPGKPGEFKKIVDGIVRKVSDQG